MVFLARTGANADLVDALRRYDVHDAGERGGVVVALAQELLAQVRMGIEVEDAQLGERRRQHLDHRHGSGVVAAEHERDQPGPPPGGDLLPGGVELLPGRRAGGELAVADVGDSQVFQVAGERGRVGLDRLGAEPDVERTGVGALAEVHPALERDAVDDDTGVGEGEVTADEARRHCTHEFFVTLASRRSIASGNWRLERATEEARRSFSTFQRCSSVPEKRFFLAMGKNGPYSETSFM